MSRRITATPRDHADASSGRTPRIATLLALLAVAASLGVAIRWNTAAIGGSDSHCYAGQARMFTEGRWSLPPPIAGRVPWPSAPATFVPSGFAPSPDGSGASVPLCPAGLSLVMAAALKLGGNQALFLVVPLLGALAVWCTFVLGRRMAGPWVGAASAVLVACSPIFLYQVVQPMSDVPAAAFWVASLAAAAGARPNGGLRGTMGRALGAGLLAGAAIMMRPNLAPLTFVPVLLAGLHEPGESSPLSVSRTWRWPPAVAAALGVLPGVAAVAWLQMAIYGSPLRSGYGDLGQLFSLDNVAANLVRYSSWLATAHSPVLALGLAAPLVVRSRTTAWLLLAFALGLLAMYLPYVQFTDWWYTRFLLPALPVLIVMMTSVAWAALGRLPRGIGAGVLLGLALLLGGLWEHRAGELDVFRLKALERKYVELGRYATTRLPPDAIVLAAQPTGSIRFYANLPTLSWDAIAPEWLDRVLDDLRARGLTPYFAIESWEADAFRARFRGHSPLGDLDWPPRADIGRVIFVYGAGDRASYLAGEQVRSDRITWPVR